MEAETSAGFRAMKGWQLVACRNPKEQFFGWITLCPVGAAKSTVSVHDVKADLIAHREGWGQACADDGWWNKFRGPVCGAGAGARKSSGTGETLVTSDPG
jgi:hypothetical protein